LEASVGINWCGECGNNRVFNEYRREKCWLSKNSALVVIPYDLEVRWNEKTTAAARLRQI
jgi:hypothetical protein